MAVFTAAELSLGIIKMHGFQIFEAHNFVEILQSSFESLIRCEIITRGEGVASVETNSNS